VGRRDSTVKKAVFKDDKGKVWECPYRYLSARSFEVVSENETHMVVKTDDDEFVSQYLDCDTTFSLKKVG
jgi:hypothetical protein